MSRDVRDAFRVVVLFWLAAWFCNAPGTPGFWNNFSDALAQPLSLSTLPPQLQAPLPAFVCYLAPIFVLAAVAFPTPRLARAAALLMFACGLFACLHVETANDATFVTALWTAAWLNWLVYQQHGFHHVGRGLAHAIVGLVFLGGLVGKLTPEYWSGEAFYRLYFRDNQAFPYPWLRQQLSTESFRGMATTFSRASIWAETMLALAPILPTRFVLGLGTLTMFAMLSAWTFHLFSVLGSLLGLLVAAELLRRRAGCAAPAERSGSPP